MPDTPSLSSGPTSPDVERRASINKVASEDTLLGNVGLINSNGNQKDMQPVTTEGFRTLGLVSTFIAGVEGQCLGLVGDAQATSSTGLLEAANALLLTGLLLSSFGAAVSLLAARWFDLLSPDEIKLLNDRWEDARQKSRGYPIKAGLPMLRTVLPPRDLEKGECVQVACWRDYLLAKTIQHTLSAVFCGFYSFIIGMLLYTWETKPLITAIISTVITLVGTLAIIFMHLNFNTKGTLHVMHFNRIRL